MSPLTPSLYLGLSIAPNGTRPMPVRRLHSQHGIVKSQFGVEALDAQPRTDQASGVQPQGLGGTGRRHGIVSHSCMVGQPCALYRRRDRCNYRPPMPAGRRNNVLSYQRRGELVSLYPLSACSDVWRTRLDGVEAGADRDRGDESDCSDYSVVVFAVGVAVVAINETKFVSCFTGCTQYCTDR